MSPADSRGGWVLPYSVRCAANANGISTEMAMNKFTSQSLPRKNGQGAACEGCGRLSIGSGWNRNSSSGGYQPPRRVSFPPPLWGLRFCTVFGKKLVFISYMDSGGTPAGLVLGGGNNPTMCQGKTRLPVCGRAPVAG